MLKGLLSVLALVTSAVLAQRMELLPTCIRSCEGEPNSLRANCENCHMFHICVGGLTFNYTCPSGLFYDRLTGNCTSDIGVICGWMDPDGPDEWWLSDDDKVTAAPAPLPESNTPVPFPAMSNLVLTSCVTSCVDLEDGDYQSCTSCSTYVSCSGGRIFTDRLCPPDLVWDDVSKRCEYKSQTCEVSTTTNGGTVTSHPPTPTSTVATTRYPVTSPCLTSCTGQANGKHQWCRGCDWFVHCYEGTPYLFRCLADLVWDDVAQSCNPNSYTCVEADL